MSNSSAGLLDPAGALGGTEILYVEQGGQPRHITLNDLAVLLNGQTVSQGVQDAHRGAIVNLVSANYLIGKNRLAFEQGSRDTDAFWSLGSPSRLVIPAGITKVRLGASVAQTTSGVMSLEIVQNGDTTNPVAKVGPVSGANAKTQAQVWTPVLSVAENDFFELYMEFDQERILPQTSSTFFCLDVIEVGA